MLLLLVLEVLEEAQEFLAIVIRFNENDYNLIMNNRTEK